MWTSSGWSLDRNQWPPPTRPKGVACKFALPIFRVECFTDLLSVTHIVKNQFWRDEMKALVFGATTLVVLLSIPGAAAAQRVGGAAVDSSAEMSSAYEEGREAGVAAAEDISSLGWFAGGLLGGAVAGPVGAAVAVVYAERSDLPLTPPLPGDGDAFREGYSDALSERVRADRKKRAFIGGMIGSGIFVFALIQVLDVNGLGGGSGEDGGGGPVLLIQPG